MKNLNILLSSRVFLEANIVGQCIDVDNKRIFVVTEDFEIFKHTDDNNEKQLIIHNFDIKSLGLTTVTRDQVVLVELIVESGSILIVLKNGRFIQIPVSLANSKGECVYHHNRSISSVRLSPDQDLIAFADEENDLFVLSVDFSVLYKSNALSQNESLHKPVGVGWGSKETQFFGLDGRPSKERQDSEKITISESEAATIERIERSKLFKNFRASQQKSTVVDWRGDGQYLATLTYISESDKNYLKVWNRNLELQYMSEQLVTMERGLISWIPNGQYICCAQRRDNRINELALFEKNGMIHQRVTLPIMLANLYLKDIAWSPDSKILALIAIQFCVSDSSTNDAAENINQRIIIMFFTVQNFHYYLKHSSYLSDNDDYFLKWNLINQNRLYVTSSSGLLCEYHCYPETTFSQDKSSVAVVDANRVKITPFSLCSVPPPMSALTIELDSLINRIILDSKDVGNLIVLTIDDQILYPVTSGEDGYEHAKLSLENHVAQSLTEKLSKFKSFRVEDLHTYQNFIPIDRCFFAATRCAASTCEIVLFKPSEQKTTIFKTLENQQVVSIARNSGFLCGFLALLMSDGRCLELELTNGEISQFFAIRLSADRLHVVESELVLRGDQKYVISLTPGHTLRVNENILVSNSCTSFRTTSDFLVFTTTENVMHFVPLRILGDQKNPSELETWDQPIENGGVLVIVEECRVILQMPRGNLENLHPRILVLASVASKLEGGDFIGAIKLARRHRADLNFLCDYMMHQNPNYVDESLDKFVNDVANHDPSLLNLFITELNNDDTISNRYRDSMKFLLKNEKREPRACLENKINTICGAIKLPDKFVQPKLLCLLRQEPRKAGDALKFIKFSLMDPASREAALRFLLYFIDIDQLFLDALSTYDTDIALMVAGVSTKDPKEYLNLLDSFNEIEDPTFRKYKINLHIKNYENAFKSLLKYSSQAGSSELHAIQTEMMDLVVSKRIYREAIRAFKNRGIDQRGLDGLSRDLESKNHEKTIGLRLWSKYGDYLLEKRHHLEAGLAYSKALNPESDSNTEFDQAIKCFSLAGDWKRSIALIARTKLDDAKRSKLLESLSKQLLESGKFAEAIMLQQPIKNHDLAFKLAKKASWSLAEFIVDQNSEDELQREIVSAIHSDVWDLKLMLQKELAKAKEQFERLKELLSTYQARRLDHPDADEYYTSDSLSTVDGSDTSSVSFGKPGQGKPARSGAPSIKTRASSDSSRSQSEKKKKRINLKQGSRYEDIALVLELKVFVSRQKEQHKRVTELLASVVEYNIEHDDLASEFNGLITESYELANVILEQLWPRQSNEQLDQMYSLYKRFARRSSLGQEPYENLDFEILVKPALLPSLSVFEF